MTLDELIELGDPDALLAEIDRLCSRRNWDALLELRNRCHLATARGKQLWGVAAHGEYRIALQAPVDVAVLVIDSVPSPFAIAPLTEVVASRFAWSELSLLLSDGPLRGVVAYERVARGEDLNADESLVGAIAEFEMPLKLASWEPSYESPTFTDVTAASPRPLPEVLETRLSRRVEVTEVGERETTDALVSLVGPWVDQSNGTAVGCVVEGGIDEVMTSLHWAGAEARRIAFEDAVAMLVWAGANGGAEGRRPGLAAGRSKAWWALAAVADLVESWPVDSGEVCAEMQWWTWASSDLDDLELAIAAVDPVDGLAFGIFAVDAKR